MIGARPSSSHAASAPGAEAAAAPERAPADVLDRAYGLILQEINFLSFLNRANLRVRGLKDEQIATNGYVTMPTWGNRTGIATRLFEELGEDTARSVPGLGFSDGKPDLFGATGIVIPLRDAQGRIIALKVRADNPPKGMPKYTYVSSFKHRGCSPGSPVHVPLGITAPAPLVRITEGELKADIAFALSGVPTISFPGADMWSQVIPVLRELSTTTVRVAFDADCETNQQVARRLLECANGLRAEEFAVELERWSLK
jgi:hypothetical protein